MKNKFSFVLVGVVSFVAAGMVFYFMFDLTLKNSSRDSKSPLTKAPLYWVAPMDSNYRRDKPGKSPMGMDLVPVYEESASGYGAGAVKISPEIINNLGVRTVKVIKESLHTEIKTVGYVQYDENKLIHIHPRVQGWVDKLFVTAEGDPVKKGQRLYEIYSPELVNAQEEFVLALDRKNNRLINAAKARLKALQFPADAISQLEKERKVQQTVTFYVPQDGVVDNLKIRQGFYVKPGNNLMSIGALDEVWVEAELFERQVPFVKLNSSVSMTLDYLPGREWHGKVDYIYPTLNEENRTAKIRLKFPNAKQLLKPNMFAQVSIHADMTEPTLLVPREAVIRTGNQDRVVVAFPEGRFKSVEVTIGLQNEKFIEILNGVFEGDDIVSSAQFLIDSESSKSSDFKRMQPVDAKPLSVWTSATINSVMLEHKMINAYHEPITEWDWPEMTMGFLVDETVDIGLFKVGMTLSVEITDKNNSYTITNIHIMGIDSEDDSNDSPSAIVNGVINMIDIENRIANISRGPIKKWERPAATLDFQVAEEIELSNLKVGSEIYFRFVVDDDFKLVEILENNSDQHNEHH